MDAGLDPAGFADGGGQRSDTMLLLRFVDGEAQMMSIPRDLYVPIAETGGSQKINAAYNGGPRRLVQTVQQSLGVPIDHYLEVDFVSFAKLVDALGGITIDFPHPAFDRSSGLDVRQAGPGGAGRAPRRWPSCAPATTSRSSTARRCPTLSGDLGRVLRQQQFLKAVFSELGSVKNPITLARAAGSAAGRAPHRRHPEPVGGDPVRLAPPLPRSRAGRAAHPAGQQRGRLGAVPGARGRRRPRPVPLAPDAAPQGRSTPGLRMPSGSRACLIAGHRRHGGCHRADAPASPAWRSRCRARR